MKLLRMVSALLVALALQSGLGLFWSEAHRYVDLLLIPVVWFGLVGTQRSAMLVGCAAGLLEDAWFQIGLFGINGFKRTFLGWALGGLGSRFDLNHSPGRFVGGFLVSAVDSVMDAGLRRLMDQSTGLPTLGESVIRALVTGVLVVVTFAFVEAFVRRRRLRRLA